MDFINPQPPEEVEAYLRQYDGMFRRPEARREFRAYIAGLLSETHRKNVGQIAAKVIEGGYEALHHFLSDSPWDAEQVNMRRLELWQAEPATRMGQQGWWIQDDTGQERRFHADPEVRGTDGVARQYIGNVGKVSEGLVFVTMHYADQQKHTPVRSDLYWPDDALEKLPEGERTPRRRRDKIDIALDQARWVEEHVPGPKPRRVVADPWYGSNPRYLKALNNDLKWTYVAAIRSNRKIFPRHLGSDRRERRADEVINLVKPEQWKEVSIRRADGTEETVWAAELRVRAKKVPFPQRLVFQVDDRSQVTPEEARYLLCNANRKQLPLAEVVRANALRNWVEVFYGEGKDKLGLDQAEVRLEERLMRHWTLVMVAHSMLELFRCRGGLSHRVSAPIRTRGDVLRSVRDLFRWDLMVWLRQAENLKRWVTWFCSSRGLNVSFA